MTPPRIVTSNKGLPRIVDPFGTGKPYYVIVGRGPAAICNHATLRKSKAKKDLIGKYRVLHIGFPDSWNEYVDHDMGQAPRLLGLPGYSHPVGDGSLSGRAGRCKSTAFATSIGDEWKELVKQCGSKMAVVEAVVLWVQRTPSKAFTKEDSEKIALNPPGDAKKFLDGGTGGCGDAPYQLVVQFCDGSMGMVCADYIDFCTGLRPMKLTGVLNNVDQWCPPLNESATSWLTKRGHTNHTMMSGTDALRGVVDWPSGIRVACYGNGGVGLNMVERAEDESKQPGVRVELDWISDASLLATGMALPDNVAVLRDRQQSGRAALTAEDQLGREVFRVANIVETTRGAKLPVKAFAAAEREPIERLVGPFCPSVRFIRKAPLKSADIIGNTVRLTLRCAPWEAFCIDTHEQIGRGPTLTQSKTGPHHYAPYSGSFGGAGNHEQYDRFVWTIGQDSKAEGTAHAAVSHLGIEPYAVPNGLSGPSGQSDLTVGLSTKDKRVRLLGACGQYYVDSPMHTIGAPGEQAKRFFAQLPVSAVLPGFVYMGINIALANAFFTPADPNPNVNTMTHEELIDVIVDGVPTPRNAFEVADDLMAYRRSRNGFRTLAEFIAVAWASAAHRSLPVLKLFFRLTAANIAGRIATAYPAVSYSP